jgi:hypothetical protein
VYSKEIYSKKINLFGRKVLLSCRKAKSFLSGQELYRELILLAGALKENKDNERTLELIREYEIKSLFYQIILVSDSLKVSRNWLKFWNWNLYRKFGQSYIKNNIPVQQLKDLSREIGILEGNEVDDNDKDIPADYIPLDPLRVKAFVHKHTGHPYDKIDDMYLIDFFDSIKFAGEMLKVQVEGGKINLTKEHEMAYHFAMYHKLKADGKLGKIANA